MKPRIKLAESIIHNETRMALYEHDGAFSVSLNGKELMHSKVTASESLLGRIGVDHINKDIYLESDYLVYPLHQSLDKKGLLICEYPNEEQVLNKICQSFVQLLGN